MSSSELDRCLAHLEGAEEALLKLGDSNSLCRLALVIDMLRKAHGLAERPLPKDIEDLARLAS